ncbi:hypothetical protein CK489_28815 [Bradyrhizobium sp. UFLA03-84]|uniref:hypothetical protein n=1 Tax=Bradyrhizobium sp. UFLA03-84 TaxID=418599 RepID=UPI000BADF4D5|nr:hypothetical protein [Bradyrhizobium sp. UFLA03-84]PAY05395.1 hypothetical protein CK489_28815 [Bradyrhizobium sp. UFLA03-84]
MTTPDLRNRLEVDTFAESLGIDIEALRISVRSAGLQAANAVERRKTDRRRAKDSRQVFKKHLPRGLHELQIIQRANLSRITVTKAGGQVYPVDEASRAIDRCIAELLKVQSQCDFIRLPCGGGTDFDQLFIALVDRLQPIWERDARAGEVRRATFASFICACWRDLGWPDDFRDKQGQPMGLEDAVYSRLSSRQKNST